MNSTKDDSRVVEASACLITSRVSRPLAGRQDERADRAHRAAFGRRGDAEEDGAEHEEDQRQRRDQHDDDLLGQPRHHVEASVARSSERDDDRSTTTPTVAPRMSALAPWVGDSQTCAA